MNINGLTVEKVEKIYVENTGIVIYFSMFNRITQIVKFDYDKNEKKYLYQVYVRPNEYTNGVITEKGLHTFLEHYILKKVSINIENCENIKNSTLWQFLFEDIETKEHNNRVIYLLDSEYEDKRILIDYKHNKNGFIEEKSFLNFNYCLFGDKSASLTTGEYGICNGNNFKELEAKNNQQFIYDEYVVNIFQSINPFNYFIVNEHKNGRIEKYELNESDAKLMIFLMNQNCRLKQNYKQVFL